MEHFLQIWSFDRNKALESLQTTEKGLTEKEAETRLDTYSTNTFHNKEKKSAFSIFFKQFKSPLIFLLVGASIITAILAEWIDTGVILFAVFLNVILGFYHEYHAENTLDKLTTYIKDRSKIVREGREMEIDSAAIVPGDILKLSYGSRIPADARILYTNNLRVDEAILTGESLPIEKEDRVLEVGTEVAERNNIVHAGTLVVEGYGEALVYATGNSTEIGKIAGIVSKVERSETPLQKSVNKLAWFIFGLVIVIVLGILFLGISRGEELLPMLVLSAAVAVGAVPEALPIVLTVILAIGATKIANKKGIVRKLAAAETLGSTTLIMTDKTGTLTKADMQLVGIKPVSSVLNNEVDTDKNTFDNNEKKLIEFALHNVDVTVENINEEKSKWNFKGRPFEVNIVKSAILHGINIDSTIENKKGMLLPFNSTNKFSVSLDGEFYNIMGAPDILLKLSNTSKEDYLKIMDWIDKTSNEGKRLIGLARIKNTFGEKFSIENIKDINFVGMLLFFDPIRPEVPQAIKNIESHGIKMVLVTGDLPGTALSVARDLDWHATTENVLTGVDLRKKTDEELLEILPNIKIFARVTPEDKLRIGTLYQKLGEVVAMTGDGVNDSPALKAMDIGISLGSGSDVAKSAADLVLLDDNFETISLAIEEGRKILSNIRKSFVYLMSNSLDEVFVIGGSLIFNLALPLTALQIIWVNLFTGSLPALSFAFDENIDHDKYKGKDLQLIFSKEVKILTLGIGILSSALLFVLYYFLLHIGLEVEVARSIFFVCFSSYILAITYSFRSLSRPVWTYNIFANSKLNISLLISLVLLIATMTVPFMRNTFSLAPMPISWIPFVFLWIIVNILLVEGAKYVMQVNKKV